MTVPLLVALDAPLWAGDVAFTYTWPQPLVPGTLVVVPFRTRLVPGFVVGPAGPSSRPLRPIITPLEEVEPLPPELVDLAEWMARRYLCSIGEALAAMVPPGLMGDLRLRADGREADGREPLPFRRQRTPSRETLSLDALRRALGPGGLGALADAVRRGTVRLSPALPPPGPPPLPAAPPRPGRRSRVPAAGWAVPGDGVRDVVLIGAQRDATYLAAAAETLEIGRSCLFLFPSVHRAEAAGERLSASLPASAVVLHADLPADERLARWLAVRRGEVRLVAGTRGAVFAPLPHLGLIVVDDEADAGHKEERVPRYHVREVARRRGRAAGARVVLADQVPSLEAYELVRRRAAAVVRRDGGTGERVRVAVIDLRRPRAGARADRPAPGPAPVLSEPLLTGVRRALRTGGRVLLFVHRRGYAGLLVCAECGHVPRCPRCHVPLGFNPRTPEIVCRYCRWRSPAPTTCANCGGTALRAHGAGTQRVARLAARALGVSVARLDADSAPTEAAARAVVRRFRREGGILVATPLVFQADPPLRVDLAAAVLAEASFHLGDFRAHERGLRALWSLRGLAHSWLILQTYAPDHPVMLALRRGNLPIFYREELRARRSFGYPPSGEVVTIVAAGTEAKARKALEGFTRLAREGVEVLGPAATRQGPRMRWQVMLRARGEVPREPLMAVLRNRQPSGVRLSADVDGSSMMI